MTTVQKQKMNVIEKLNELKVDANEINKLLVEKKDVLQIPSLEQYKNQTKMANTKWYSMLTNKTELNKKIGDIDPKELNIMFTQLYKYAKTVKQKQNALQCNIDSKDIYGKITTANNNASPPIKFDDFNFVNDGKKYITEENGGEVKIFLVENSDKKEIFKYIKPLPDFAIKEHGKVSKYVKDLRSVVSFFGRYISAESSNALMLASQRYLSRLTEYTLSVSTNLDAYINHQGLRDDYLRRMVRYIALVKQFILDKSNQSKPFSEALYYGLYHNIDERNFQNNVPEQATCQHVSKMGSKFAKLVGSPIKFTYGLGSLVVDSVLDMGTLLVYNPVFLGSLAVISSPFVAVASGIGALGKVAKFGAISAIGEDNINSAYRAIEGVSNVGKEIMANRRRNQMQNKKLREIKDLENKTEKLKSSRYKKKRRTIRNQESESQ